MKKTKSEMDDDLRAEYDFSNMKGGVKGKYAKQYHEGTNIVVLEPDVAKAFPTDASVNEALRLLMRAAEKAQSEISTHPHL
jgi:hypothetical protein